MPKRGVRVIITGSQRRVIEVDQVVQIIIALGRELAARKRLRRQAEPDTETGSAP